MPDFELRHIVGFDETNVVGNVYFTHHLRWQGRCRELFLREHAPELLEELRAGLAIVTVRAWCEYVAELTAFDEIIVRMRLGAFTQSRMTLRFDYYKQEGTAERLVARGEQDVACMRRQGGDLVPAAWPASLAAAVCSYRAPALVRSEP